MLSQHGHIYYRCGLVTIKLVRDTIDLLCLKFDAITLFEPSTVLHCYLWRKKSKVG